MSPSCYSTNENLPLNSQVWPNYGHLWEIFTPALEPEGEL